MNTKNAFSTLFTILITAVIVGVLTGVISYSYAVSKKDLEIEDLRKQLSQAEEASVEPGSMALDTSETANQDQIEETTQTLSITDETANWKTYSNDGYNYLIKYPSNWNLSDTSGRDLHAIRIVKDIVIDPDPNKRMNDYWIDIAASEGFKPNLNSLDKKDIITWVKKYFEERPSLKPDSMIPNQPNASIGNLPAVKVHHNESPQAPSSDEYFLLKDSKIFIFTILYGKGGQSDGTANQILSAFHFTK